MSTWRFLDVAFPGRICPWWLWDQLIKVPKAELQQWDVFRGHFLSHLEPYLGRKLMTFTMLRHPVERTISHYYHVRRSPDHPSHSTAVQMSLAEFCVDSSTRQMVENYQSNYLAKSPACPESVVRDLTPSDLARFLMQEKMQYPDEIKSNSVLFERAKQRLASFTAVGFSEDFADSIALIGRCLNSEQPAPSQRENVAPERPALEELDRRTLNTIRDVTTVDERLYAFAREPWKGRSEQPVRLTRIED